MFEGLKSSAVIRRFNHNESLVSTTWNAINWTFTHHGAPSGAILGDEILRDLSPIMGSELCSAVETSYSLSYLYHSLGRNTYADLAERVVFNALPVMTTADGWAHQYMDQPNAPWTNRTGADTRQSIFTTSGTNRATVFGLEPEYPCCTVNFPQGWPKFLSHSWATVNSSGLAHTLLSPSVVRTNIDGYLVIVSCQTAYPFDNVLTYSIQSTTHFTLSLRVPSWSLPSSSSLLLNSTTLSPLNPDPHTGLHAIPIPVGNTTITYTLSTAIRTEPRGKNSISVYVGPILYALDVGHSTTSSLVSSDAQFPQLGDYYFANTSSWNIAIDPSTLVFHRMNSTAFDSSSSSGKENTRNEGEGQRSRFDYGAPTGWISVQGCEIAWGLLRNAIPDQVPEDRTCLGSRDGSVKREYRLVPYGTAKVHMSELPVVDFSRRDEIETERGGEKGKGNGDGGSGEEQKQKQKQMVFSAGDGDSDRNRDEDGEL